MVALFLTADVMLYTQEYNWKRYMYILQEALGHRCQNDLGCLANLLSFDLLQGKKISPATKKNTLDVIPALHYTYNNKIFRPQAFSTCEKRKACTSEEKINVGNSLDPVQSLPFSFHLPLPFFLYSPSPCFSFSLLSCNYKEEKGCSGRYPECPTYF